MIVPSFTTLFAKTSLELTSNKGPLLLAMNLDESNDSGIFFRSPGTLNETGLENFLPSVETLNVTATRKMGGNLFPILSRVFLDCPTKLLVFFFCPLSHGCTALCCLFRLSSKRLGGNVGGCGQGVALDKPEGLMRTVSLRRRRRHWEMRWLDHYSWCLGNSRCSCTVIYRRRTVVGVSIRGIRRG